MAKKKQISIIETNSDFNSLAKDLGGEVLENTDSVKCWIDTGNLALNYLCSGKFVGGGIPSGKVIEIFGASSSCKTLFGTNILKGCQKAGGYAIFLDAENSLNKEFALKASHLETSKVVVLKADTLQKAFAKMTNAIKRVRELYGNEKPLVIVYDSIAASPSDREYAETEMTEKQLESAKDMPGERAKVCSKELRKLNPILEQYNATVLFINQVRATIGVMYGPSETTAGGGKALPFYAALRLKTSPSKKLFGSHKTVIGMGVNVSNVKNKCFKPFVNSRNMQLLYDQGINPFGGLLDLLIQTERVKVLTAGNYQVNEPFCNGEEIKFKSSLERNDVPVETLLKCPSLVDANSVEEIEWYSTTFGSAMEAIDNDVKESVTITEENEE